MAIDATAEATLPNRKHRIIQPDISLIELIIHNDAINNSSSKKKVSKEIGRRYRVAHEFAFNWFLDLGKNRECGLPYITHSLFTSLQFFGFTNGYIPINDFASKNLAVYFASYDVLDLLISKPKAISNETYAVVSVLHDVIEDGSRSLEEAEKNLKRIENMFGTKPENIEYGRFIAYNVDVLTNKYSLILSLVENRIKKRNFDTYLEMVDCITGKVSNIDSEEQQSRRDKKLLTLNQETLRKLLLSNIKKSEIRIKALVESDLKGRYDPAYYREVTRAVDNLEDKELTDVVTARVAILRRIKENGKSNFDNIKDTLKDIEDGLTDEIKGKYAPYFRELGEIVDVIENDPQYHQMSRQKRKEVSIFRLIKIQGYERYTDDIMRDALTRLAEGDSYFDLCPLSKMADNIDNLETMNPSKRSSIKWTLVKAAILNKRLTEYHQQVQEFYNSVDNKNSSAQLSEKYIRIHEDLIKQHRMALINSAESRKIANRNFTSLRYAISMIPYLEEKAQDYRERFGIYHRIETVDAFKRYKYREQRYFRNLD